MQASLSSLVVFMMSFMACSFVGMRVCWYRLSIQELEGRVVELEAMLDRQQKAYPTHPHEAQLGLGSSTASTYNFRPCLQMEDMEPSGAQIEQTGLSQAPSLGLQRMNGSVENLQGGEVTGMVCAAGMPGRQMQVAFYLDGSLAGRVQPTARTDLPGHDRCGLHGKMQGLTWAFSLPFVAQGEHQIRVFIEDSESRLHTELQGSPLSFLETSSSPGLADVIKKKEAIIRNKNLQLAALYNDFTAAGRWEDPELADGVEPPLRAFVAVFSRIDHTLQRRAARETWMPSREALEKLERHDGIVIRFVVGKGEAARDRGVELLEEEAEKFGDIHFMKFGDMEEDEPRNLLTFVSDIPRTHSAQFYFKITDEVVVILPQLLAFLQAHSSDRHLYVGCFKAGSVVTTKGERWYEPEFLRFGDPAAHNGTVEYIRHASASAIGLSGDVVRYLARNSRSLKVFANQDTTLGSWLLGLKVDYRQHSAMCCTDRCRNQSQGRMCIVALDSQCGRICGGFRNYAAVHTACSSTAISTAQQQAQPNGGQ